MEFRVRPARADDIGSIVPWTTDTFDWGDYVPERMPQWIAAEDSEVLVCVDDEDLPWAVCHVAMLSATEAWLEGARVHPDQRRSGMGSAMNRAGVDWAREQGARVMRLATETDNEAAVSQVEWLGYRLVSRWAHAEITVTASDRSDERFRMRPAPRSDADAAWLFWAASDLALHGRELFATGWQWRRARAEDLYAAVDAGQLLQSSAGWAILDRPAAGWFVTNWVATTPEDLLGLLDGLLDHVAGEGGNELDFKLPDLPWTVEAMSRAGGEPKGIGIYALAV